MATLTKRKVLLYRNVKYIISNIHLVWIADGKIVEHWGHGDDMDMMRHGGDGWLSAGQ